MVGIIGAMDVEVDGLIAKMSGAAVEETHSGITYVKGKIGGADVVVARCGIGKVNAAVCAQTMILRYAPRVVLNTGVAGAISPEVRIGDIVIATGAVQHDFDLTPIGLTAKKGFILELDKAFIPCEPDVVSALCAAAGSCHTGVVASGDQFINCADVKAAVLREFDALACEMEGAAIAHVCALNGVPFGIVRTISDSADEEADFDFGEFVKVAAKKSVEIISRWLMTTSKNPS